MVNHYLLAGRMLTNSVIVLTLLSVSTLTNALFLPSLATVHEGDSAVFVCSSRYSDVDFQFRAVGSRDSVMIYNKKAFGGVDSKYANEYRVDETAEVYTLTVINASPSHAGTYICEGNIGTEPAELVVLASGSEQCVFSNSNGTDLGCGTDFRMECNVAFHGNFSPVIEFWTVSRTNDLWKVPQEASQHTAVSGISKNVLTRVIHSDERGIRFACKPESRPGEESRVRNLCTSAEILVSCNDVHVSEGNPNVAAIVVPIIIGVVVFVILLFVLLYIYRRHRSTQRNTEEEGAASLPLLSSESNSNPIQLQRSTDKLEILELLSDGGYFEVYKAKHADFGIVSFKRRCVDVMPDDYGESFRKEAEVPMRLNHENVIKLLEIIFVNAETSSIGTYGVVYEYLESGNLHDVLDMFSLDWSNKLSLLLDVASGMQYLHSQTPPIIHGDLRAENIFVGYNYKAKISEFCFPEWKIYSQSHSKRKVGFEPVAHYPPEFVSGYGGSEKSEKFDVYSFGILFWGTITQQKPFSGLSNTTILGKWAEHEKRPDITLIPSDVSLVCRTLIESCWCQVPNNRPQFKEVELTLRKEFKALTNYSNILSDEKHLKDEKPLPDGGYIKGYKANHSGFGLVVYKELNISGLSENDTNALKSEARTLMYLNHPNLVRMLAMVVGKKETLGIIYPYHENENLFKYLQKTRPTWMKKVPLLHGVACGMRYIHGQTPAIIHGDLKIENVLVSVVRDLPIAKICDFGLPQWKACSVKSSRDHNVQFGTHSITPPEYLANPGLSKDSTYDVYSFSILMYQTMTLQKPYTEPNIDVVKNWVLNGKRPSLDRIPQGDGVSQTSVKLMEQCWNSKKGDRPDFQAIAEELRNEIKSRDICSEYNIQTIGNGELRYEVNQTERFDGYFSAVTVDHDVLGKLTLKTPSVKKMNYRHLKRIVKEASSYKNLDHRNILKFHAMVKFEPANCETINTQSIIYGIAFEHAGDRTLNEYLRVKKLPWDQKLPLLHDVASGMSYLHTRTPPVTHGELKAENVFVREDDRHPVAKICNFGFSLSTERNSSGTIAHFPPENLNDPHHSKLEAFDVYGFAILLWQTLTPNQMPPYSKETEETGKHVYDLVVHDKVRPNLKYIPSEVSQTCIDLMKRCWSTSEADRPFFKEIAKDLSQEMQTVSNNNPTHDR